MGAFEREYLKRQCLQRAKPRATQQQGGGRSVSSGGPHCESLWGLQHPPAQHGRDGTRPSWCHSPGDGVRVLNPLSYFPVSLDPWDFKQSTRNISPTINQANIVDLHPASVYSIRMYSFNKIGRSEPSKELTISTEEAGAAAWPPRKAGCSRALFRMSVFVARGFFPFSTPSFGSVYP